MSVECRIGVVGKKLRDVVRMKVLRGQWAPALLVLFMLIHGLMIYELQCKVEGILRGLVVDI